MDNPQIELYFDQGKTWRKQEYDALIYKLDWYEDTNKDLEKHLSRESRVLTQAEIDYHTQKKQLVNKIDDVVGDRDRFELFKKNHIQSANEKQAENNDVDQKIDEQRSLRT